MKKKESICVLVSYGVGSNFEHVIVSRVSHFEKFSYVSRASF